jgi:heme/copper-type cytochrome/quinol oxidase subunit 2
MTEEMNTPPSEVPLLPESAGETSSAEGTINKKAIIIGIVVVVLVVALVVFAAIFLLKPENSETTERIRDLFIIFMALGSLVIGIALVILIVQLSSLINLLQNEIKPIITSTSDTVNTLKGTATFISDNISEPVIKLNQFMAMIGQLFNVLKRK